MSPYLYAQRYEIGASSNYAQYSNSEVNKIILRAKTGRTEEEAMKYWREFQKMVSDDVANVWIGTGQAIAAISNRVKGVLLWPFTGMVDLEKASIERAKGEENK